MAPSGGCAATGQRDHADAVGGRRPDGQPVRYRSWCQGCQDCSLDSPPGGSSCRHLGLEQRCPLSRDDNTSAVCGGYPAEPDSLAVLADRTSITPPPDLHAGYRTLEPSAAPAEGQYWRPATGRLRAARWDRLCVARTSVS